ncbi:holo-ACP synthase [bacterium]|nr:holo-ACP synthase [bacterium]
MLGTGVDIVATGRVARAVERFGARFLDRCFRPDEVVYCQRMKHPTLHLAARFAAKEAVAKAFGTGIGRSLGWTDIEIAKHGSGEPFVVLHGKGSELARQRGAAVVLVSLSHCDEYAVAQAVLVAGG